MRNVNKFSIILCIFFSTQMYAQIQNGKVKYIASLNKEKAIERMKELNIANQSVKAMMTENIEFADDVEIDLVFNDSLSYYYGDKSLRSDNAKSSTLMALISGLNNPTYTNSNSGVVLKESPTMNEVLVKQQALSWDLEDLSRKIGSYICYKAVTNYEIDGRSGKSSFLVEAWYAPEIPARFGPYLYSGLPGLILEVNIPKRNLSIKAVEIKLNPNETISINLPNKKVITQNEANNIIRGAFKALKDH